MYENNWYKDDITVYPVLLILNRCGVSFDIANAPKLFINSISSSKWGQKIVLPRSFANCMHN
jgi:hypothetical protein